MFRKVFLSAFAALALMFAANAPANAAMALAKPEAARSAEASQIIKVGRRGGRGFHFRFHHGWHHGHWRPAHVYRHCYWRWGKCWSSRRSWYRHCRHLQRHGHRVRCYWRH